MLELASFEPLSVRRRTFCLQHQRLVLDAQGKRKKTLRVKLWNKYRYVCMFAPADHVASDLSQFSIFAVQVWPNVQNCEQVVKRTEKRVAMLDASAGNVARLTPRMDRSITIKKHNESPGTAPNPENRVPSEQR